MKSMKLWMGLAVAVSLATGCGGSVVEDACDRLKNANDDAAERLEACLEPGEDTSFDTDACVEDLEQCSEESVEATAAFVACALDATTCNSFDANGEPTDAYVEDLLECDEEHNPSSSCLDDVSGLRDPRMTRAVQKVLQSR